MSRKVNILNQRFGRLTVIAESSKRSKTGEVYWICQCNCGNTTEVIGSSLRNKLTTSCGCFNKEQLSKIWKGKYGSEHNRYDRSISDEERLSRDRRSPEYIKWVKDVKDRAMWECELCGNNHKVEAHHVESYTLNPSLRFDINNGVVLCKQCHKLFHKLYGKRSTYHQFSEFTELMKSLVGGL